MKVGEKNYRTIWLSETDDRIVRIINQLALPHSFETVDLHCVDEACFAIKEMQVRGAGLIGATAAFGMYLATLQAGNETFDQDLTQEALKLKATRPTASNLAWAVDRMLDKISAGKSPEVKRTIAKAEAQCIVTRTRSSAEKLVSMEKQSSKKSAEKKENPVNVLTHCNAGWLAFVDHGSATAPIYAAHDFGISSRLGRRNQAQESG